MNVDLTIKRRKKCGEEMYVVGEWKNKRKKKRTEMPCLILQPRQKRH